MGDAFAWAVCLRETDIDDYREPHLFVSESEAKEFLDAEIDPPSLEFLAEQNGTTVEEEQRRRTSFLAEREEALRQVRSGEMDPLTFPVRFQPIYNRDRGWQKPVCIQGIQRNAYGCPESFARFMPLEELGDPPPHHRG